MAALPAKRVCLTPFTIITGGARGADYVWALEAHYHGYRVVIESFKFHQCLIPKEVKPYAVIHERTELQNQEALDCLKLASTRLQRNLPKRNIYVYNLILSNWWIAKFSEAMYAVGYFDKNGKIEGGTAWGCEMFMLIHRGYKPLYFFDCNSGRWYQKHVFWEHIVTPPLPSDRSACIGTRMLNHEGSQAIHNLFNLSA